MCSDSNKFCVHGYQGYEKSGNLISEDIHSLAVTFIDMLYIYSCIGFFKEAIDTNKDDNSHMEGISHEYSSYNTCRSQWSM